MRVALVSQYYAPEIGATQNRMAAFADGIAERGHELHVVCEQPNHPAGEYAEGFGRRPIVVERAGNATVHRLWVATSPNKTTAVRLAFYGTFAAGALLTLLALPRPDVVLATSPPLPGAWAAAAAARLRRIPFVLDVRDLWPAAAAALGELSNPRLMRAFERGERWIYRTAASVAATTRPFCRHIDRVAGRPIAVHVPNGALDSLIAMQYAAPPAGDFVVGYAGNLGIAQGLSVVLDAAERLRDDPVRFRLIGSGPMKSWLQEQCEVRRLEQLTVEEPLGVEQVGTFLQSCHALLVPLRNHPLLEDFIPSKLYDAMAVGRPVLVAAGREARSIVEEVGCGLVVPPEDGDALANAIRTLAADPDLASRLGAAGRSAAHRYSRARQVERMIEILETAADTGGSPVAGRV